MKYRINKHLIILVIKMHEFYQIYKNEGEKLLLKLYVKFETF